MGSLEEEWILVLDNSNENDLRRFLPPGKTGNILYTSRKRDLGAALPPQCIADVNEMEHDDAISLLLSTAGHLPYNQELRAEAAPVVTELGCLPLAIDQAGAYVRYMKQSFSDYLALFRSQRERILRNPVYKGADPRNDAVYATFDISYNALHEITKAHEGTHRGENARTAINILRVICFYHNEAVMAEMFRRAALLREARYRREAVNYPLGEGRNGLEALMIVQGDDWDPDPFRFGLKVLSDFSLIKWEYDGPYVSMHVLVSDWAKDSIENNHMAQRVEYAKAILLDSIKITKSSTIKDIYFRRKMYPHVEAFLRRIQPRRDDNNHQTKANNVHVDTSRSTLFSSAGRLSSTRPTAKASHTEDKHNTVESDDYILGAEYNAKLGFLFKERGRYERARDAYQASVGYCKREWGPHHPLTLECIAFQSSLETDDTNYGEAASILLQIRELREGMIKEIRDRQQEREVEDANPLQEDRDPNLLVRLKTKREARVEEDKTLLKSLSMANAKTLLFLGGIYMTQTSWDAAENVILAEIEIRKHFKARGIAFAERQLSKIRCRRSGDWDSHTYTPTSVEEASELLQDAIETLGHDHLKTMDALQELVKSELKAGNLEDAQALARQFHLQCIEVYGPGDHRCISALALYAEVITADEQHIAAEGYYREVLVSYQREFGLYHPNTLHYLGSLGGAILAQGRWDEGELLIAKAIEGYDARLGASHYVTVCCRQDLETLRKGNAKFSAVGVRYQGRCALAGHSRWNHREVEDVSKSEGERWVEINHIARDWGTGLAEQAYFNECPLPLMASAYLVKKQHEEEEQAQVEQPLERADISDEFA